MRARRVILIVLLFAWSIFIGTPQSWAPFFRTPVIHFLGSLGLLTIVGFLLPGRWVLLHVWHGFFPLSQEIYYPNPPQWQVWLELSSYAFAILFSYAFWVISLSRFWKFIGRWNPFGVKATRSRPHVLKMITAISNWWEMETKFGRHATGGFASLLEVLSNEFQHGDIFLGRPKLIIGGMLRPIGIPTEKHMVTIAGTGSGKSTGALIPNLCLHGGSALVIDPKGELAAITARSRGHGGGGVRGIGQDVYVLDPFHIVPGFSTASYNVFDEMERVAQYDADRPVSYARKIAQALVPSTSSDPYWDDAPRTFISGLLLYIFQGPKEHRNLVRLRELLMEGDVATYRQVRDAGGDERGDAFDALLMMMKQCPDGPYYHVVVGAANSLSKMSRNQRGSVLTMAMEHTSFLDIPELRKISMRSDFLLEDLKNRHISVYLCLPLNAVSGIESRWLRMFVLLTVDMMTRVNKAPNPPLLMALDEFPSLGKLDGIETVAPTMRSQGVRLWVIGQDIEQFEKVYPDSWGTFIGGAEAVQFMGITHPPTVAYIAERLGQHVVVERQKVGQGQVRENASERPVRDPEQIARMLSKDGKNQIIWRGNKRPMMLKICPYYEYMPWWYYSRDRRFKEKWNRWIWRRGKDYDLTPPHLPPHDPPPDGPPRYIPPSGPPEPPGEEIRSYLPEVNSYLPSQPSDLKPSDNVPGTNTTWGDAVTSFIRRANEESERQKKTTYEQRRKEPVVPPSPPPPSLPPRTEKPKPASDDVKEALSELDGLIGLDEVKKQVRKTMNLVQLGQERARKGLPHLDVTHHLVFTGNPGTGKTTVARIVGRVYKDIGLLKSGHMVEVDRGDLIAEYVGQTAPKVTAVIAKAMDGVLFIDEAYSLTSSGIPNDFGGEAVATLLKAMEDYRDRLVVIVAGYKDEMKNFIEFNPGLKSRFKTFIDFEDYDSAELFKIFVHMGSDAGIRPSLDAQIAISALMESLDTGKKGFGNGRTVRNIFEECLARQAQRLSENRKRIDVTVFEAADIPKADEMVFS
jgi:type IV secretory pathway TraG/TraD family ATPase VirD4/AAA+ superfamily predicted ATPase